MHSYDTLHNDSRVWIYQTNRPLTDGETVIINQALERFATDWVAHNMSLKAYAKVYFNHFIVLMVDETNQIATGCSIDKSVKFLQQIEQSIGIQLFDRLQLAYKTDEGIRTMHSSAIEAAVQQGIVTMGTTVFNNLVQTKADFESNWVIPLADSWVAKRLSVS